MKILIKKGRVVDPNSKRNEVCDVLIENNIITKIEANIKTDAEQIIDAQGCLVMPGFIDLHVHLRDPGLEHKETLITGGQAAARGGVTTMCAMPNTKPVIDSGAKVAAVHSRAKVDCLVNVIQVGAVTVGQIGNTLADIEGMAAMGCKAISEDGKSVMDISLYRESMKIAKKCNVAVFAHCEDIDLVKDGVMHADAKAESLGLKGITNEVEDVIVARDIELAKETGVALHLCHCSTKDSVSLVAKAKTEGVAVTAEVCPHHFILTTDDITEDNGRFKMNPPLRSKEDVEALKIGLKNDVMDVIATDHAPHAEGEKNKSMKEAAFGIVGLETLASLTYTELVDKGVLSVMQMAEKMSSNPAKILGIDKGTIAPGKVADVVVFDPNIEYFIDKQSFLSKGKNTPFHGRWVKGEVLYTLVEGKIVYKRA